MVKRVRMFLLVGVLIALFAPAAGATSIIPQATPIPNANILVNFQGSGLDWVYAGPVGPNEFGVGQIELPSYRASEGWRFATQAEWANHPDWTRFVAPGFTPGVDIFPVGGENNHAHYIFASEYWGNFSHVDTIDFFNHNVTNGNGIFDSVQHGVNETLYVRNSGVAAVPEPASMILLGSGLLGVGFRKLRSRRS